MSRGLLLLLSLVGLGAVFAHAADNAQMSLVMAAKMNSITSVSQLFRFINESSMINSTVGNVGYNIERKAAIVPEPAGCRPEKETIKLRSSDDTSLFYFPSCTRIERCGGCCTKDDLLSCQPIDIDIVNFEVIVTQFKGGNQLSYVGKEIIPVEKHLKCKCDCIVKPSDCNRLQSYQKGLCQCVCTNKDEQKKCYEDSTNKKFWNPHNCSCDCLSVTECSSGYTFNKHTCSCETAQRPKIQFSGIYGIDSRVITRRDEYSLVPDH